VAQAAETPSGCGTTAPTRSTNAAGGAASPRAGGFHVQVIALPVATQPRDAAATVAPVTSVTYKSRARIIDSHQDGASTISLPHPFIAVLLRAMAGSRKLGAFARAAQIEATPSRSTSPGLDGRPSPA
jgi:hypothetical protein